MNCMMKRILLAWSLAALPAAASAVPLDDGNTTSADMRAGERPSTPTVHGIVEVVDEGNDTIAIRLSPDRIEKFKVQDGLLFNAVRYGDRVEVVVENVAGARTIVGLTEE